VSKVGTHTGGGDFQFHWTFLAASNPDPCPRFWRQGTSPGIQAKVRGLGPGSAATQSRRTRCI
jgi:hypothetical protein